MEQMIYLDNAATTFPKPEEVYQALDDANRNLCVNAGRGTYQLAKKATALIETCKKQILGVVCPNAVAEVIFASSATVAFNQVVGGLSFHKETVVYVSPFEHNAVMRTLHLASKKCGFQIEILETIVDKGSNTSVTMDLAKIEYQFARKRPDYVFCTHVSNVTGYILPIKEICAMAKAYGTKTVIDASQSVGLVAIDMDTMDIDCLVFAGHKTLYGPLGIGGFVRRLDFEIQPFLSGGTGSDSLNLDMSTVESLEVSSPNIVAIAGLSKALEVIERETISKLYEQEAKLTEYLIHELKQINGVVTYLPTKERHTGIVALNVEGYQADEVGMLLDEDYNIAVRTGYHCAPLVHELLGDMEFGGVVRVSVSRFTTMGEVEEFVEVVREIVEG